MYCEARVGYYYQRDDASFIFRRMIFTPIYNKPSKIKLIALT